jgi:site-specific recombinase XerD
MTYIGQYEEPPYVAAAGVANLAISELKATYLQAQKGTGAKANTLAAIETTLGLAGRFLSGIPVSKVRRLHIEQLSAAYGSRCPKAITFSATHCTAHRPLKTCPLLTGGNPTRCPDYKPNQPSSVQTFLGVLNTFFEWLIDIEAVPGNPVRGVIRAHARRNKAALGRKRMTPGKAQLAVDDWRVLVPAAVWHNKPMWDVGAKNGLRPHEMVKLHRSGYDRVNRRIPIPEDLTGFYGDKRIGWAWALLDDESMALLDAYVDLRDKMPEARKHDMLFVTRSGKPWSPKNWDRTLRRSFKGDLRRAKLESKATPHSLRGLFNTEIRDAPDAVRTILRGGKLPGHESRYVFNDGIRDDWERYHPRLGADAFAAALPL